MSEKYKNKYRIASSRADWWDYSANAAYFITICTKDRKSFFGNIKDGKMNLSNVGILADVFWHEIKNHSKAVELDAFVVMPNHIHGILILNNDTVETRQALSPISDDQILSENIISDAQTRQILTDNNISDDQTRRALSLQVTYSKQRFQNQGKNSVSSIIGSYKSAVTKHANRLGLEFGWQTRFHDHIIRNDDEFVRISNYIENNVQNWKDDKFYL